jgi:hypothetical protein
MVPPGSVQSLSFQVTRTIWPTAVKQMPSAWVVSDSGGRKGGSNQETR